MVVTACSTTAPDYGTARQAYQEENFDKSIAEYERLADFGMPKAYVELGKHYLWGKGVERDSARALNYFQTAKQMGAVDYAERYIPRAEVKLASNSLKERSDFYAPEDALIILSEAAEKDNRNALFELGFAFERGNYVAADGEKALDYYLRSGEQGYSRADYYAAELLYEGDMVAQDRDRAIELYKRSGDRGYERANERLSEIL
jgi:TPR repeat protein